MIAPIQPNAEVQRLLWTSEQACEALQVCRKTLYNLSQPRGTIPVVKVGTAGVRYDPIALAKWIAAQ